MTPLPAPVITIHRASVIRRPKARAWREMGSRGAVRADPKTVTLRTCRYGAKTRKPCRSSLRAALAIFRSIRAPPSSCILRTVMSISVKARVCSGGTFISATSASMARCRASDRSR